MKHLTCLLVAGAVASLWCSEPFAQTKMPEIPPAKVYTNTDWPAYFKGDIGRYMSDHFEYPDMLENGFEPHNIWLVFTVNTSGYLQDIKVEKSSGSKYYDANALKMLWHMNDSAALWAPALLNGEPVNSILHLPMLTCLH